MALITWRGIVTGATNYLTVRRATDNQYSIVAGATFEALTVANWANYVVNMTESPASSYFYSVTFPINPAQGWYYVDIFNRSGGSPAISDPIIATMYGYWNGVKFEPAGGDIYQVAGDASAPKYVNGVFYDTTNGTNSTAYPYGEESTPTNSFDNAITIANATGRKTIKAVRSASGTTHTQHLTDKEVIALTPGAVIKLNSSYNIQRNRFIGFDISNGGGAGMTDNEFSQCTTIDADAFGITTGENCLFSECFISSKILFTGRTKFDECHWISLDGVNYPMIDCYYLATSAKILSLSDCTGCFTLKNTAPSVLYSPVPFMNNHEGCMTVDATFSGVIMQVTTTGTRLKIMNNATSGVTFVHHTSQKDFIDAPNAAAITAIQNGLAMATELANVKGAVAGKSEISADGLQVKKYNFAGALLVTLDRTGTGPYTWTPTWA